MTALSLRSNIMNAYNDISLKTEEVLQIELEVLKQEHRDLDEAVLALEERGISCLLYTSPSPRDRTRSRMPSSA